jgi:ribonuclease P protein component
MAAQLSRAGALGAAKSLRSAPKGSFIAGFPKRVRLLRSQDFRRVYERGARFVSPLFAAFCVREPESSGPRIGFTVPRKLGSAVVRNRLKRRFREAVRPGLDRLNPQCSIVINPRLKALNAPLPELEREVERLLRQCNGS